jgi:transposase
MAKPLVSDELWAVVAPLLPARPPRPPRPKGGRPPVDDRAVLTGILFGLRSGIPWEMPPREMGCGSGMTCWRRLRDWQAAGVQAPCVIDANGIPLAVTLSPANRHDSRLEATVDAIPAIRQCAGRPRRRPTKLHADKGYDFSRCRHALRRRAIIPRIAPRGIDNSERLGRHRWKVERTLAWFARFRRIAVRYERRIDIFKLSITSPPPSSLFASSKNGFVRHSKM